MKLPQILMFSTMSALGETPDFGPNVVVAEPGMAGLQETLDGLFKKQERAQFGEGRHAVLFRPGEYKLDFQIGFYTQVSGLGMRPGDVTITGGVGTDAAWMRHNATCNFWRTLENLTIDPAAHGGSMMWAVSQAAPLRRVHVKGNLKLSSGGWSSGGFLADSKVDGVIEAGSQQQWFSRNSSWKDWTGGHWNMFALGCEGEFGDDWEKRARTEIPEVPPVRERPWLRVDAKDEWALMVPPVRPAGSRGPGWDDADMRAEAVPLEKFHLAKPDKDNAASLNAALAEGKNLLFTPGIYQLDDSVIVKRAGTIVYGLGHATLIPVKGKPAMIVEAEEDVVVAGLTFDAAPERTETLLRVGIAGKHGGSAARPVTLHDIFCRVGGHAAGATERMVEIRLDHVIGDHLWLWRADHGKGVGWETNPNATGLLVEGDGVTMYGLFVEHTQAQQTIWNGEDGRTYFYQCELPYDPPSKEKWSDGGKEGYAAYQVGDGVTRHEAWGMGVYHVFKAAPVVLGSAIQTPEGPGIRMRRMVTKRLLGGKPGSGIRHVINGKGGEVIEGDKATVD